MIAIIRKSDNAVMNDRQSSDWPKQQQLANLQTQLAELPSNTAKEVKDRISAMIATLQNDWETWNDRRILSVVQMYGGNPGDYEVIAISQAEEADFFRARFIEYDGSVLTYHSSERYAVNGLVLTIHAPQWVKGNYCLLQEDVTDFTGISEPMNFSLSFWQDDVSLQITVELFTWSDVEDEDTSSLPGKTKCSNVCRGRIENGQITIS